MKCPTCQRLTSSGKAMIHDCAECAALNTPPPPRPIVVTTIAGYVPPKGSIAAIFLGRVIRPLQGLDA